jgi:tRNA A-37 threonylcarbamoyl transferase component Bud32
MLWLKDFKGHSGCKVQLYENNGQYIVYKNGSPKLKRSAELLNNLRSLGFNTPEIYSVTDDSMHMEYINGVDMKTYIFNGNQSDINKLFGFLDFYITTLATATSINILPNLITKLHSIEQSVDLSKLNFTCLDLLGKLPKTATCGTVHGDFTLDNILFYKDKFYLIDANPTELNHIEFDAVKIRQDLDCLWFVRNEKDTLNYRIVCQRISNQLKNKWPFLNNDYILIFMLMRILPYCTDENTQDFLIMEINKLWQ